MFERFTEDARRVIVLAQQEATSLRHHYIGTEHLLLGVIESGGPGAGVLRDVGCTADVARAQVAQALGTGSDAASGHVPFTPGAKRALEVSALEATKLGDREIRLEHLLLALLAQPDGAAVKILHACDVDVDDLRQRLLRIVRARAESPDHEADLRPRASYRDVPASDGPVRDAALRAAAEIAKVPTAARLEALALAQRLVMESVVEDAVRAAHPPDRGASVQDE